MIKSLVFRCGSISSTYACHWSRLVVSYTIRLPQQLPLNISVQELPFLSVTVRLVVFVCIFWKCFFLMYLFKSVFLTSQDALEVTEWVKKKWFLVNFPKWCPTPLPPFWEPLLQKRKVRFILHFRSRSIFGLHKKFHFLVTILTFTFVNGWPPSLKKNFLFLPIFFGFFQISNQD